MSAQLLEEEAEVLRVEGEIAWIDAQRRSTCSSCAVQKGCGTGALAKVLGQRKLEMIALNRVGARPGDRVVVGIAGAALLKGSLAVYMVPLLLFFAMALLGQTMAHNLQASAVEGWVILFALGGLLLGFLWVHRFGQRIRHDVRYQPVILRVVRSGQAIPIRPLSDGPLP